MPRVFVLTGRLSAASPVFLLGRAHAGGRAHRPWLAGAPGLPAPSLPLFRGQLITPINISLQILAASQTSPHLLRGRWLQNIPSPLFLPPPQPCEGQTCFAADMHLLVWPLVFLRCRFMKRSQGKPHPQPVRGRGSASQRHLLVCIPVPALQPCTSRITNATNSLYMCLLSSHEAWVSFLPASPSEPPRSSLFRPG